jgi:hypothetical protein
MPLFDAASDAAVLEVRTSVKITLTINDPRKVVEAVTHEFDVTTPDRMEVVEAGTHWFDVAAGDYVIRIWIEAGRAADQGEATARLTIAPQELCVVQYEVRRWTGKGTITVGAPLPVAVARSRQH